MNQKEINRILFVILVGFVLGALVCGALLYTHMVTASRLNQTLETLDKIDSPVEVRIDGQRVDEKNSVLVELRKIRVTTAHHSHPTKKIDVRLIVPQDEIDLILYRDSELHNEYWVFLPGESHEIGRLRSELFSEY